MAKLKYELSGQRFGKLTVVEREQGAWGCVCDCGGRRRAESSDLVAGRVKSCGCLNLAPRPDKRVEAKTGDRYARLTLVEELEKDGQFRRFRCRCDCGREVAVRLNGLRTGNTKSCGCLVRETSSKINRTHGMARTRTHRIWKAMLTRVRNPNIKNAKNYSGRGIGVDPRWETFENFLADMGEAPAGKSLDRVDNDLGYSKANCRWATQQEQTRNQERSGQLKRGVSLLPNGKWRVSISSKSLRKKHIGVYSDYESAVQARLKAEQDYWAETETKEQT